MIFVVVVVVVVYDIDTIVFFYSTYSKKPGSCQSGVQVGERQHDYGP